MISTNSQDNNKNLSLFWYFLQGCTLNLKFLSDNKSLVGKRQLAMYLVNLNYYEEIWFLRELWCSASREEVSRERLDFIKCDNKGGKIENKNCGKIEKLVL